MRRRRLRHRCSGPGQAEEGHSCLTAGTQVPGHDGWVTAEQMEPASEQSRPPAASVQEHSPAGEPVQGTRADGQAEQPVAYGLSENRPLWSTAGARKQPGTGATGAGKGKEPSKRRGEGRMTGRAWGSTIPGHFSSGSCGQKRAL